MSERRALPFMTLEEIAICTPLQCANGVLVAKLSKSKVQGVRSKEVSRGNTVFEVKSSVSR